MAENGHVFSITVARPEDLSVCSLSLFDSDFGNCYFPNQAAIEDFIRPGFDRGEVVCAANKLGENIGFVWLSMNGAFGRFPFLYAIGVKPSYRSIGVGSFLLEYAEETAFTQGKVIFTLANSSSQRLLRFFQRRKYRSIGKVPQLILPRVDESILMKTND